MSYFVFGDFDTRDYEIYVYGCSPFNSAERDAQFVSIPGRNGDIINDNKRFKNVPIAYHCIVPKGFQHKFDEAKMRLNLEDGYKVLRDGMNPGVFRKAAFHATIEPTTKPYNDAGKFDIVFNCMPQRFLDSGDAQIEYSPVSSGGIDSSGANTSSEFTYRVEYMAVEPGKSFRLKARFPQETSTFGEPLTVAWYRSNKTFLSLQNCETLADGSEVIDTIVPANAAYARFMYSAGTTYWIGADGVTLLYGGVERHYGDGGVLLINPTGFKAKPVIRFMRAENQTMTVSRLGTGASIISDVTRVVIGDYTEFRDDIVIDSVIGNCYSEYMDAFYSPSDLNQYVTITDSAGQLADYPVLGAGLNLIEVTGFESMTIQAGWWTV